MPTTEPKRTATLLAAFWADSARGPPSFSRPIRTGAAVVAQYSTVLRPIEQPSPAASAFACTDTHGHGHPQPQTPTTLSLDLSTCTSAAFSFLFSTLFVVAVCTHHTVISHTGRHAMPSRQGIENPALCRSFLHSFCFRLGPREAFHAFLNPCFVDAVAEIDGYIPPAAS